MTQNSLPSWSSLQTHYEQIRNAHLRDWFAPENDPAPTRAERFAFAGGGLAADFSKNRITDDTLKLLVQLAREAGVEKRRDAMFAGEVVNPTEGRAALHTALRASSPSAPFHAQVQAERAKMAAFADQVRSGAWTGYTGKRIRHVVNIGIGGSDLGPKMVVHALHHLATPEIATHFVSNVDGADLYNVMQQIDPEETLAIIVSKTFTTLETMTNARSLRDWFIEKGCPENALAKHFVGVSANPSEVVKFGIAQENVFEMWDWVGGRYSLWSAVGLSIMIAVGPQQFGELLAGANDMDEHFRTAPLDKNLPVLLGMIGIWYRNFFGSQSYLVAPYSEALHYLPSYLQQLEMESNGKSARLDGAMVDYPTSAVTWGEPGTNGQHAFFQMLHQGPTIVPIDFVAVLTPEHPLVNHHAKLLANCFAQSEALMLGRTLEEAKQVAGPDKPELAPHLVFPGNRPTSTLILD
ncbi:MAG: glucose-6-phosphate isomerase, partial [Paraburkholderia graminis]|uniref:glucose-6-phosphate isomerase n=1 Tax=Paraburkholderia graminis TaxID=60548 RepID=UPI00389A2806